MVIWSYGNLNWTTWDISLEDNYKSSYILSSLLPCLSTPFFLHRSTCASHLDKKVKRISIVKLEDQNWDEEIWVLSGSEIPSQPKQRKLEVMNHKKLRGELLTIPSQNKYSIPSSVA